MSRNLIITFLNRRFSRLPIDARRSCNSRRFAHNADELCTRLVHDILCNNGFYRHCIPPVCKTTSHCQIKST